jgi:hypothetical protein
MLACPHCGTGKLSSAAGYESAKKRPAKRGKGLRILALLIVVAAIIGVIYLRRSAPVVPIETLIPEAAGMVGVSDTNWWWNATAEIRESAEVRKAMEQSEKQFGISFEKDVVPWMGEMGVVSLGMASNGPQFAILGQVKDEAAFRRFVDKAQETATREGHVKWTEVDYHGVKLQQTEFNGPPRRGSFGGSYPTKINLEVGLLGRWFVVGVGEDSAEKIIDTWQHRAKSINQSPKWQTALAELRKMPGTRVGWLGYEGQSYFESLMGGNPMAAKMVKTPGAAKLTTVCALFEESNELKMEAVSVPNDDMARAIYTKFAQSKPVAGKCLSELPDGTFTAVVSMVSWDKCIEFLKQMVLDMSSDAQMNSFVENMCMQVQPVLDALTSFTGESAVALTWKDGVGFGGVLIGETSGSEQAKATAGDLQSFAQMIGAQVKVDKGLVKLPQAKRDSKNLNLMLCWGTKDQWLKFGSHPNWLTSKPSKTKLQIPAEAKDAVIVGIGDFSFLPLVLKWAKSECPTKSGRDGVDVLNQLGLNKAQWAFWAQIDNETGAIRSTAVLRNWEWRKAVKPIMDFGTKQGKEMEGR